MEQATGHCPKVIPNPNAREGQIYAERFLMTHGFPSLLGQRIHHFQEQEKHNMKNIFIGKYGCPATLVIPVNCGQFTVELQIQNRRAQNNQK